MNRTQVRAVEAYIRTQHDACDEASNAGRTWEADIHYGMERGATEALKIARRTKPRQDRQTTTTGGSRSARRRAKAS